MPTTLVAQVDSAYGGKTGVDLPEAKNYVGAYHLPSAVLADTATLATLPPEEMAAGFVEVVKTALIAGGELWERVRGLEELDPADLTAIVFACARTKLEVVAADERDAGRRAVLNLGHTVGHAIEAASGYERYRHGEAVGARAARGAPAVRRRASCATRWRGCSRRHGLPTSLDDSVDVDAVIEAHRARQEADRGGRRLRAAARARRAAHRPASRAGCAASRRGGASMKNRVEVLHGVNFDVLGRRDPEQYGGMTLPELEMQIKRYAATSTSR